MSGEDLSNLMKSGRKQHSEGNYAAAVESFVKVLSAQPDNAEAHHRLGLAFFELNAESQAVASLQRALSLAPDNPVYHHNLAIFMSLRGNVWGAEGHLREAIRLKPDYAEAFYNLSSMVKLRHPDPLTGQIETLLSQDGISDEDTAFLHFAGGKLYDDLKDSDRAFEHFTRANAPRRGRYDKAKVEELVQALRYIFTRDVLKQRNEAAVEVASPGRPIFIVGMPRSGTSLAEQILASHSKVHGAGELKDIKAISQKIGEHVEENPPYPVSAMRAGSETYRGYAGSYIKRMRKLGGEADFVVNKMPLDFWHLGLIVSLFRNPVILHCQRGPLDTCLSCYFQNFKPAINFASSLESLGHYYRMYHSMMEHWKAVLPVPIIDVPYETLVAEPEAEAQRIIAEIGLPWEPGCARPDRTRRTVKTASSWQVRQPVYRSSAERWKRYEKHLLPLRAALEGKV